MKTYLLVLASCLGLIACTSTAPTTRLDVGGERTSIKDTQISTAFVDDGIKIHYTFTGKLERIEVFGLAQASKRNHQVVAEADAMDKLVKFIHGKSVSTERRVRIVSKSLELASDRADSSSNANSPVIEFDSKQFDSASDAPESPSEQRTSNAHRAAKIIDQTLTTTVQEITASGRLRGVRKIGDRISQDGKIYTAIFQWSKNDQAVSDQVRHEMFK